MNQKLILPINDIRVTASINTRSYKETFGFSHYGTDLVSVSRQRQVYSSGEGEIVASGIDKACGKVLIVIYKNAYNHENNKVEDLIFRYFHLDKILVKPGQKIKRGELLGEYGNTGKYAGSGKHLHLEVDLDTQNYLYTPTVIISDYLKGTSQGAKNYNDKNNTVKNVMDYLYVKEGYPECQTFSFDNNDFVTKEDRQLPTYSEENWELLDLINEHSNFKNKIMAIKEILKN